MTAPWWPALKQKIFYYATHYTWAFVAVMAVTLASCLFSIHYLSTLETDLKDVYENDIRGGDSIQTAYTSLVAVESAVKDLVVFPDRRSQLKARDDIRVRVSTLKASMANAAPRFYTPKAKQALENSKDDVNDFLKALQPLLTAFDAGKKLDTAAIAKLKDRSAVLQKDFDLLVANRIANSSNGMRDLVSQLRVSLFVTIVILALTVLVRVVLYISGHPGLKRRKTDFQDAPRTKEDL